MKKRRRNRMQWVHPINLKRNESGAFHVLFQELRNDPIKFYNYFRMSISTFDELHGRLKDSLQRHNTFFRECIQPTQMLVVAIRYLASGCTFTDLHYSYRLGISIISKIVKDLCKCIWSLYRDCIPVPTKAQWESIAQNFERKANFPHCIGAVDGKHIRIVNPSNSMYFNYKGFSSVVLMAVAVSDYRFIYVDVGSYGKDCDSNIFKAMWKSIVNKELEIPEEKCLSGTTGTKVPYFIVGDEAFALHRPLLRPYGGNNLTVAKRIFNYQLEGTYVECAFGILSNKWRIFHRPLNLHPDYAVDIVKACVVLHKAHFTLVRQPSLRHR
ncbi:hypothetical protein J437_LFUL003217 [Ladona fulva]|uniref:DDE Tnp4 domain-containing protein n=1 Tax=Ladona fulva TaxID=123851 RepID=A0A8K0NYH6_LADFU|nr:hypothetical protein J437_LFUL003217 [Ladona fulva]